MGFYIYTEGARKVHLMPSEIARDVFIRIGRFGNGVEVKLFEPTNL